MSSTWLREARVLALGACLGATALHCENDRERPRPQARPRAAATSAVDAVVGGDAGLAELGADSGLPFRIGAIYRGEQPSSAAPWHEPGGDWTFFDATTADGVPFGFGFRAPAATGDPPIAFGEAILTVKSRDDGQALVVRFMQAFGGRAVAPKSPQPLRPAKFSVAVLGRDMGAGPGALVQGRGTWHALKLFLQRPGIEAEVFCNFDLQHKVGGFAEKDSDYADAMIAFLAGELRDGPRPRRSSANDPSIVDHGPRIEWLRALPGRAYGLTQERDRYRVVERLPDGGSRLVSLGFEREDDRRELVRVPHRLGSVACAAQLCLAMDERPKHPEQWSSADPRSVFVIDGAAGTSVDLGDALGQPTLEPGAVAPDGSYGIVFGSRPRKVRADLSYDVLYVVDRAGKVRGPIDFGEEPLELVAHERGKKPVVRVGYAPREYSGSGPPPPPPPRYFAVDPGTLAITPTQAVARPDERLSPSGKRRVSCRRDEAVVVTDVASGAERLFALHEDDRPYFAQECPVTWASDRYLDYRGSLRAFLDVETLRLDEMIPGETTLVSLDYSADFRFVVENGRDGLRLGRIVVAAP